MINRNSFVQEFARKCQNDVAALFLGAGISSSAGFPSWKALFKPLAIELGIHIDETKYQLYDIAQFYENEKGASELYKRISEEINKIDDSSDALDELTNMQCNSIWTTNFDHAIENNFNRKGKKTNVVFSENSLINVDLNKNVNIFKMNGDGNDLYNAIITKKNLENYNEHHNVLLSFFKKELIVKTFLFIGYSFTDALVLPCIFELSRAFNNNHPYHYSIMKKDNSPDFMSFIKDLEERYHIKTLLIDDFKEIPSILKDINYFTNRYNVFISGSYSEENPAILGKISKFCNDLTYKLYKNRFRIVNGYGYKVGYYIASAATKIMIEENVTSYEKYLLMYPFDEHLTETAKQKHREFMLAKSNAAIFLYGSPTTDRGMIKEFNIAKQDPKKIIIPVGSTGGAAKIIYDEVKNDIIRYPYLEKFMELLQTEQDSKKMVDIIITIIQQALAE